MDGDSTAILGGHRVGGNDSHGRRVLNIQICGAIRSVATGRTMTLMEFMFKLPVTIDKNCHRESGSFARLCMACPSFSPTLSFYTPKFIEPNNFRTSCEARRKLLAPKFVLRFILGGHRTRIFSPNHRINVRKLFRSIEVKDERIYGNTS